MHETYKVCDRREYISWYIKRLVMSYYVKCAIVGGGYTVSGAGSQKKKGVSPPGWGATRI